VRKAAVRIEPAFAGGRHDGGDDAVQAGAQRKDRIAAALALIAASTIVVNALYLQKGPHPAPLLNTRPPTAIKVSRPAVETRPAIETRSAALPAAQAPQVAVMLPRPRPADLGTGSVPVTQTRMEPAVVQRPVREEPPIVAAPIPRPPDPIGQMIAPEAERVMAVQRVLTEFGYGQIRPTGTFDAATREAIEAFQRAHKMPATGQITPALMKKLSALSGRSIE
jgi:hypothetical protein